MTFGAPPGADVAEFVFDAGAGPRHGQRAELSAARRHLLARTYFNPPELSGLGTVNSPAWRAAEIPSANCHASARGVAAVFARLPELLDADLLAEATRPWSDGPDVVLDRHTRFGLGFQLTQPDRPLGPGPRAYGHFGAGRLARLPRPRRRPRVRLRLQPLRGAPLADRAQPPAARRSGRRAVRTS